MGFSNDSAEKWTFTDAIAAMRDNPNLRESMAKASLRKASNLTIEIRTKRIIEFIKERM